MKIPYLTVIFATLLLNGCSDGTLPDSSIVAASMAQRIAAEEDHITAVELADRLMKDRPNFELIDIRDERDFYSGHIQGARHIPLARLIDQDSLVSLPPGRTIVVYSNGTAHAAQAALLLYLTGRDALALLGGYNYWQAYLYDPEKAGIVEMDSAERKRYQAVSCYFAGNYVADAGLQTEGPIMLAEQQADPLGLGLGLGSEQVQEMDLQNANTDAEEADPLGLGLELGLGGDAAESVSTSVAPPKGETQRLLIRKEC